MEESKDQKIWQVVLSIPKGKVASYGQVAQMAGLGRQARYIGRALGKLPVGHQIPWYRVLRSNGQIAFPEGSEQFENQKAKLEQEGVEVERGRVKLSQYQWRP
ncbi:MAG: cysteine methyltransferase [Gammaproteobacteria bacterium]|nr:MAG: cysteine methyltransferase [Gammaproteobacteria bacterium]